MPGSPGSNDKFYMTIAGIVFVGYTFVVGLMLRDGQDMPRGVFPSERYAGPKIINNLAQTYGGDVVGGVLMVVSMVCAVLLGIWLWRSRHR